MVKGRKRRQTAYSEDWLGDVSPFLAVTSLAPEKAQDCPFIASRAEAVAPSSPTTAVAINVHCIFHWRVVRSFSFQALFFFFLFYCPLGYGVVSLMVLVNVVLDMENQFT